MGASVRRSKCGRLRGRRRGKCEREKQNKTKEQRTANEARWKMRRKRGAVTEERPENNEMMEKERSREKCCATLKWININMLSWWWMRPAISRPSTGHHESLHPFPSLSPFLALPAVHSSLSLSLSLSLFLSLFVSSFSSRWSPVSGRFFFSRRCDPFPKLGKDRFNSVHPFSPWFFPFFYGLTGPSNLWMRWKLGWILHPPIEFRRVLGSFG